MAAAGILEIQHHDTRQLQNVANVVASAKKVVVVTGAGISTNCGIPDFRSERGLYSLIHSQARARGRRSVASVDCGLDSSTSPPAVGYKRSPTKVISPTVGRLPTNVKGKDLFDAQLWSNPTSAAVFYRFISSLRETIKHDVKHTTATHRFIRTLRDNRKLVRCYTQNIDGLEARERLSTDLGLGKGSRQRFTRKSMQRPWTSASTSALHRRLGGDLDPGCEVVQLHGELDNLRCTICQQVCAWGDGGAQHSPHTDSFMAGTAPLCQSCVATDRERQDRGKRGTKIGTLRPNIVLYGEEHPSADVLGSIATHDLTLSPDLLLILGTSLNVHGLKRLVREFAKSVHARAGSKGKVIFINLSKPTESTWKGAIDVWVNMDCDAWVAAMKKYRPDLFRVQEELKMPVAKKGMIKTPPSQKKLISSYQPPSIWDDGQAEKENPIANDSVQDVARLKERGKVQVIVPSNTPKKMPLQECQVNGEVQPLRLSLLNSPKLSQAALLPGTENSIKKRKRRVLSESQIDLPLPQSKRRRGPVEIWSEEGIREA